MFNLYLWVKAFHVIAVIYWVAGLLMLARLYVYHSKAKIGGELEAEMVEAERRLLKIIMNPAMIVAFILGFILIGYNMATFQSSLWLYLKIGLAFSLIAYHGFLAKIRKEFLQSGRPKSEKFFRMINEIPALIVLIIVICAVVKPF